MLKGVEITQGMEEGDRGAGRVGGGRDWAGPAPQPTPAPGHCPTDTRRDEGLLENWRWWALGQASPQQVEELLFLHVQRGPECGLWEPGTSGLGYSFLLSPLAGRVLEPSTAVLEELGGKFQAGTPSMEDAERSRTGRCKAWSCAGKPTAERKPRILGDSTCCLPSPSSWPLRGSPRPVLPPRTVAQPGEHPPPP